MIISDHDIEDGIPITVWYSIIILCWELKYFFIMGIPSLSNQYFMNQGKLALCRPKPAVAAHRPRNLAVGA